MKGCMLVSWAALYSIMALKITNETNLGLVSCLKQMVWIEQPFMAIV